MLQGDDLQMVYVGWLLCRSGRAGAVSFVCRSAVSYGISSCVSCPPLYSTLLVLVLQYIQYSTRVQSAECRLQQVPRTSYQSRAH